MQRLPCWTLIALCLSGCALTPLPADPPAPPLPADWQHATAATGDAVTAQWWRSFDSAELDALVEDALVRNQDLVAAVARTRQAQALATIAGADLLPALGAGIDAGREGRLGGDGAASGSRFGARVFASYEVDFWGRNRALRDGARADWRASVFERDAVRLGVGAAAATGWLQAVALRERAGIALRHLEDARRWLELVESRERGGLATALDVAQQRGLVASQERDLAVLRQQARDARTALAVLLARPEGLEVRAESLESLALRAPAAGQPASLLSRRPDLARAEAQLAAAHADVAAARAAMLPRLTLEAGVGTGGSRVRELFENPLYSVLAGLTAPIFDAGRLAAGQELAQARREELLADYRQAIVAAVGDVETALNAVSSWDEQARAQAEVLTQAQRTLVLAQSRYRAGADTLLAVLDAQRSLYAAQDLSVQMKLARLLASVDLYRALGGGWVMASLTTSD